MMSGMVARAYMDMARGSLYPLGRIEWHQFCWGLVGVDKDGCEWWAEPSDVAKGCLAVQRIEGICGVN